MRGRLIQLLKRLVGKDIYLESGGDYFFVDTEINSMQIKSISHDKAFLYDGNNDSNPSLIDIRLKNISNIEEIQHGKTTTWVVHHDEDFDLYIHSDTLLYEQAYWKNGKLKYQGSFKHGKLHGVGRSYSKDGNLTFYGEWIYGIKDGWGKKYKYIDGKETLIYEGEWKFNQFNGQGTYYFDDKRKYVGEFRDNRQHGKGEIFSKEGFVIFSGKYVNGKKHGIGKETHEFTNLITEGVWEDGRFITDDLDYEFELIERSSKIIKDDVLSEAINYKLGIGPSAKTTLLEEDLKQLLSLQPLPVIDGKKDVRVKDLSGLEHATNLFELDLSEGLHLGIFSFPLLKNAERLAILNLANTNIEDIRSIAYLKNLHELNLSGTNVFDLKPLLTLTRLETLSLPKWVPQDDITYLISKLPNLTTINGEHIDQHGRFQLLQRAKLFYRNGQVAYDGTTLNTGKKRYGHGKLYDHSGRISYEGDWFADQRDGFGIAYHPNGLVLYEGEWKNNSWHGQGRLYSSSGSLLYEGSFLDNHQHGEGKYYHANGQIMYAGEYSYDVWHGNGKIFNEYGRMTFEGTIHNGETEQRISI